MVAIFSCPQLYLFSFTLRTNHPDRSTHAAHTRTERHVWISAWHYCASNQMLNLLGHTSQDFRLTRWLPSDASSTSWLFPFLEQIRAVLSEEVPHGQLQLRSALLKANLCLAQEEQSSSRATSAMILYYDIIINSNNSCVQRSSEISPLFSYSFDWLLIYVFSVFSKGFTLTVPDWPNVRRDVLWQSLVLLLLLLLLLSSH